MFNLVVYFLALYGSLILCLQLWMLIYKFIHKTSTIALPLYKAKSTKHFKEIQIKE